MEISVKALDRTVGAEFISINDAARMFGMGVDLLLSLGATDPSFPRLYFVSPRKRLYRLAELRAWIEAKRSPEAATKAVAARKHRR